MEPESRPDTSQEKPKGELGVALSRYAQALQTNVYSFEDFRGKSLTDLNNSPDTSSEYRHRLSIFRRAIQLNVRLMEEMNKLGHGVPSDTVASFAELLCTPGARLVTAEAEVFSGKASLGREIMGFGLILTDIDYAPDKAQIPESLLDTAGLKNEKIFRSVRLYAVPEADRYFGKGQTVTRILEKYDEITQGGRVVGKVLVGPEDLPSIWLAARNALLSRTFEETEHALIEMAEHPDGTVQPLFLKWVVSPPMSEEGRREIFSRREKYEGKAREALQRLGWTVAHVPAAGATIVCRTQNGDGPALAHLFPGNHILEVKKQENKGAGAPPNYATLDPDYEWKSMPSSWIDAFYLVGQLGSFEERAIRKEELDSYQRALREHGKIIIQDSLGELEERVAELRSRGFRILYAGPALHSYGRFAESESQDYVLVGEKVGREVGVALEEANRKKREPIFLQTRWFIEEGTDELQQVLVSPDAHDTVAHFSHLGTRYVVVKSGYPRPMLAQDGVSGYVMEPVSAVINESYDTSPDAVSRIMLERRAHVPCDDILSYEPASQAFSLPRDDTEMVRTQLVEISSNRGIQEEVREGYSHLSTSGMVRAISVQEGLNASVMGGAWSARLEPTLFSLLERDDRSPGVWPGAAVTLAAQERLPLNTVSVDRLLTLPSTRHYRECEAPEVPFREFALSDYVERNSEGNELARVSLESAFPHHSLHLSAKRVAWLPVVLMLDEEGNEELFVGMEVRHLGPVQEKTGSSLLATAPFFLLPSEMSLEEENSFLRDKAAADFHIDVVQHLPLGAQYSPRPNALRDVIFPELVEVSAESASRSSLHWMPLDELFERRQKVLDLQLQILAGRASWALGRLKRV